SYPAEIFMGDVGSLGLGAALATMAILIKQELLLGIVGGVFVLEALSVVIQVASFKITGQRVFKMAPLHHHFEKSGWSEPIVMSPGVPPEQPVIADARKRGVPIIGELELASRWLRGRMVAITGTKGKSTTTELTGRILEAAGFKVSVGGNIGSPLSAQVAASTPDSVHVVEASSFQLEQIATFHPGIAVMLNFSADHLDRHPSIEAYAAAKGRIFENQGVGDWAVVNADDPDVLALARRGRAATRLFARREPIPEEIGRAHV